MLDVETLGAALKLAKKGGGDGGEGGSGAVIDDSKISSSTTWSSQKIVDTLCPPFTASGSVVQCTPVANSPLDVQVEITPTQEGTGDPSPENIRPIVGLDSVQVTRCGASLFDFYSLIPETATLNGITVDKLPDGRIHVHGTNTNDDFTNVVHVYIPIGQRPKFPAGTYSVGLKFNIGTNLGNKLGSFYAAEQMTISYFYIAVGSNATVDFYAMPMLVAGDVPSPAYAPYTGATATLTLPETIYGGTVDAVTGEGSEEWSSVIDLSSSNNLGILEDFANETTMLYYVGNLDNMQNATLVYCSHLPTTNIINSSNTNIGIYGNPEGDMVYIRLSKETASNLDEFKQWVDAQASAGTPVQVAYKLATPEPFQATGNQPIPALPGTNTLFADAGDITVTGASDPIATITALQSRVSALESAALN